MDPLLIGILAVVLMLLLIYLGMHIGIALTLVSFGCVALSCSRRSSCGPRPP